MSRSSQIGRWAPDTTSNFADLSLLPAVEVGRTVSVTGYHPSTTVGGGEFVGNASARHDGVIYFDPNRSGEIGTADYYNDSGSDAACWERVGVEYLTPEMAGAVGDMTTADDDAVEKWLEQSANILLVLDQSKTYRLTRELSLPANQIHILGKGRLPVYAYEFPEYTQAEKMPTFYIDHDGGCGFRFTQNSSGRGSVLKGFSFIRAPGKLCKRAIGFDVSGTVTGGKNYSYDTTFEELAAFDFDSAIDVYISTSSSEPTIADLNIKNCAFNRNGWVMRTLNSTAVNALHFFGNKLGQNTSGGVDVQAHNFTEYDNLWEGQPNPIKVNGAYRGFLSEGSYFEANTGDYLISIASARGPCRVGVHAIIVPNVTTLVRSNNVSNLESSYPVAAEANYNLKAPVLTQGDFSLGDLDTDTLGISSALEFNESLLTAPLAIKDTAFRWVTSGIERMLNPRLGGAAVCEDLLTTGSPKVKSMADISADIGDYVGVMVVLRHLSGAENPSPYFSINVNGVSAAGSRDYPFGESHIHLDGDSFKVYFMVVEAKVAITSINVSISPYGLGEPSGLGYQLAAVSAYSVPALKFCQPYISNESLTATPSAPTTGTWKLRDRLDALSPAAGATKYVCTVGGTPGTWIVE